MLNYQPLETGIFCRMWYCLSVSWREMAEKLALTQGVSDPVPALLVAFCLGRVPGVLYPQQVTAMSFSSSEQHFLEAVPAPACLF